MTHPPSSIIRMVLVIAGSCSLSQASADSHVTANSTGDDISSQLGELVELHGLAAKAPSEDLLRKIAERTSVLSGVVSVEECGARFHRSSDRMEKQVLINILKGKKSPAAVDVLCDEMRQEKDASLRMSLMAALGEFPSDRAVAAVARVLGSASGPMELAAIATLGRMKSHSAVKHLIRHFPRASSFVARTDCLAGMLGSHSLSARSVALGALHDVHPDVRTSAVRLLGDYDDEQVMKALEGVFSEDSHPMVRMTVVFVMGRSGNPRARRLVEVALKDRSELVRSVARRAVEGAGRPH